MGKNNDRQKRKPASTPYFKPHWDDARVNAGLASGALVSGALRINKQRRTEAYVHGAQLSVDVFIDGDKNRNRALNDDIVVVLLHPFAEWRNRQLADGDKGDEDALAASMGGMTIDNPLWRPVVPMGSTAAAQQQPQVGSLPHAPDGSLAARIGNGNLQPVGEVVAILSASEEGGVTDERLAKHVHMGTLHPWNRGFDRLKNGDPLPATDLFVEFHPLDVRVPFMLVPRDSVPFGFASNPVGFTTPNQKLFECVMVSWPEAHRFPRGRLVRQVGEMGEIGPETEALLIENNCDHGDFPEAALECLKPYLTPAGTEGGNKEWQIPADEYAKRRDLRTKCIFTVDPATAKDLDDALHCSLVPADSVVENGVKLPEHFEIGVHIADVSNFIELDGALDMEARRRATTVYLVQRVIPMLPPLLSEQLCSLNPGVDRLAYSCIWRMAKDGTRLKGCTPWFGRTVIRSCAKLDYGLAQDLVDGDTVTVADAHSETPEALQRWPADRRPEKNHPAGEAVTPEAMVRDLRNLYEIGMNRRKKRFEKEGGGALALHGVKLSFALDDKGNPSHMRQYPLRNTNRMVEEYMLMANYLVAEQLILKANKIAFLRRHPAPDPRGMEQLVKTFRSAGINVGGISSAAELHEMIQGLASGRTPIPESLIHDSSMPQEELRDQLCMVVQSLLKKPMKQAVYFCAGESMQNAWRHWALNIPYYTHFTSPIRRYADVCVHRQLTATLDGTIQDFPQDMDVLSEIAATCNEKKEAAKMCSFASDEVFLNIYIREQFAANGGIVTRALVQDMGERSFQVLLPDLGAEKLIHAMNDWGASFVKRMVEKNGKLVDVSEEGSADSSRQSKKAGGSGGRGRGKQGGKSQAKQGGKSQAKQGGKAKGAQQEKENKDEVKTKELVLVWKLAHGKQKQMNIRLLSSFQVKLVPRKNAPHLDFDCKLVE